MIWQVVFIVLIIGSILVGLGLVLSSFIEKEDDSKVDLVYKISRDVHKTFEGVLHAGRKQYETSSVGRKNIIADMAIMAVWDMVIKNLSHLDPATKVRQEIEKLVQETLVVVDRARVNAENHGSVDAEQYVENCMEELHDIANSISDSKSFGEIKKKILQIKRDMKIVAEADSFDDDGDQSDSKQTSQTKTSDYYGILGVKATATKSEIRTAYLKLASEYHPDKYSHLATEMQKIAKERFLKINEAYEVLSSAQKRKQYDQTL